MFPTRTASTVLGAAWSLLVGSLAAAQEAPQPPPAGEGDCCDEKPAAAAPADDCCHEAQKPPAIVPDDRKSRLLRALADKISRGHAPFFGRGLMQQIESRVAKLGDKPHPEAEFESRMMYGDLLSQAGEYDEAIEQLELAEEVARRGKAKRKVAQALVQQGLAWLRVGERANCIGRHNQDSCLFPLRGGAVHVERTGSERASQCFREAIELAPKDEAAVWLLNVAEMTLGGYPASVPEEWRIPPERIESEEAAPRMLDVAAQRGLRGADLAGGSILDDFDGDGRMDVVFSTMDIQLPLRLLLQRADGTFEDVSTKAGLSGQLGGLQVFHLDADNDGRLDLLVQRGGWMGAAGEIPNSLLLQQADGTFVDRTFEAGIEVAAPSQSAAFDDIDLDGDLDLFIGCEGNGTRYPSLLFRNQGDGTFADVTREAGIAGCGFVKGCCFGDYDRDGFPDLYVSTMKGPNKLFRNVEGVRFEEVAGRLGVSEPTDSFSSFFLDFDQDGWLDLYASAYDTCNRAAAVGAWYRLGEARCDVNRLYRNDGKGGFVDVTQEIGLDRPAFPMGSSFGDVDNDGFPDLYLSTGAPDYSALFPNLLYRNDRGKRVLDITVASGTGHLQKGHGVSFGDIDDDGDQDLLVQIGGAYADDTFRNALYENPGDGNHWLTVRLRGTTSNRFGIGARVRVRIEEDGATRDVFADGGGNSSFGGNSLQVELGLGKAERIVELEVHWPASRTTQRFTGVALDQIVRVIEGQERLELVAPQKGT